MKNLFLTLCMVAGLSTASFAQTPTTTVTAAAPIDSTKMPEITFDKLVNDFGKLPYDGNGKCKFTFTNTGKTPLVLTNVQASCGCTIPTWPKEPIEPGKSNVIDVSYNTKRVGGFDKTVTVYSNAKNGTVYLKITGEVQPEVPAPAPAPATNGK